MRLQHDVDIVLDLCSQGLSTSEVAGEDILGLFKAACDLVGVHYTRASQKQIAIYSKPAVAR